MNNSDEFIALAEFRCKIWWLSGRFFLERPDESFLDELSLALQAARPVGGDQDRPLHAMQDILINQQSKTLSPQLMTEYTRLFRGIQEGYGPPPPYESLYRGEQFMDRLTVDVQRCYSDAGFGNIEPHAGPADHIGAELHFMSLLCYREMQAWQSRDNRQAEQRIQSQACFLDDHLLAWLPDFAKRISAESSEPFYTHAIDLTLGFAQTQRLYLEQLQYNLQAA